MSMKMLSSLSSVMVAMMAMACSGGGPEAATTGERSAPILRGADAPDSEFAAVGALGVPVSGRLRYFCSGTLIGPHTVLTAKHCVDFGRGREVHFMLGADSTAPTRTVGVLTMATALPQAGGEMDLGSDVGILQLAEDITDIEPIALPSRVLGEGDVGTALTAVGYGIRDNAGRSGSRQMGHETLRATSGQPFHVLFATFDEFTEYMIQAYGVGELSEEEIQSHYDFELLSEYEVWMGHQEGDAQSCNGDSGGPLLGDDGGQRVVFGVASWVFRGRNEPCHMGTAYAVLGPGARELVDASLSDPCWGLGAEGRCEGSVSLSCVVDEEGNPSLARVDCSEPRMVCVAGACRPRSLRIPPRPRP